MNKELALAIDVVRPLVYVVGEEEYKIVSDIVSKFIKDIDKKCDTNCGRCTECLKAVEKSDIEIFIYKTTAGLMSYKEWVMEFEKDIKPKFQLFQETLSEIAKVTPTNKRTLYILLDVDTYLQDTSSNINYIRKLKDIALNFYHDQNNIRSLIVLSSELAVPRKLQRYEEVIFYSLPTSEEIAQKVNQIVDDYNSSVSSASKKISKEYDPSVMLGLKGLTLFETEQITLTSIKRHKKLCADEIKAFKKSILRKTNLLEIVETDLSFEDVGGMEPVKDWLSKREGVWTEEGIKAEIPQTKGLLLLGITGCGKSHLSKAMARQWGLPLISLNMSRVFSPRVGESEANFLKATKTIESLSPCILFIDEIEKGFAGSQSSTFSDAGTTARVIGNFLTWYQDNELPIFIIATCNSIQYLPPELVSRFDEKFFVNIPSTRERAAIFDICLKRYKRDWRKLNISPTQLADKSALLTGREIDQVVKASIVEAFYEQRVKNKGKDKKDLTTVDLRQDHIEKVLFNKVPILKTMEDDIKYLVQWVGWDEDKKDGIRANYANRREEDEKDDINKLLNDVLSSKEDYIKGWHNKGSKK